MTKWPKTYEYLHISLSAKNNTAAITEQQHELDKRKNPAKVKVEHCSLKDRIKNFHEPHKKDQKETERSETAKKSQTKEENELNEEKAENDGEFEKPDHAKEGNKCFYRF